MGSTIASLWRAPAINPVNNKAQSIPILNPFNVYGRVFLLSWWSFFVAFWSWYAFPPLLTVTIKKDLSLTQDQIANSNIAALTATLIVRLTAGAACDRFGPRWTFAAILISEQFFPVVPRLVRENRFARPISDFPTVEIQLKHTIRSIIWPAQNLLTMRTIAGAIPTALAGTVQSASGLIALRFFIGILGGSFVPCQVWTTGFFDKNIVGTANALAAGLGNAGSGVTYFLMPAIFDSLVQRQHLSSHTAWRVTFVVPFILIAVTAFLIIIACPDAPTGRWSSRAYDMQRQAEHRDVYVSTFGTQTSISGPRKHARKDSKRRFSNQSVELNSTRSQSRDHEAVLDEQDFLNAASWELVEKPTYHGYVKALVSLPTITLIVAYFCTFGTELAVNSFLGAYYLQNFKSLGQTGSGRWAAMYGLLNAIFRPMGGIISDLIYRSTGSLWGKKILLHSLAVIMGVFMIIIGFLNPHNKATMMGLMTGLAFFEEAGNGSVFALLPHVHPTFNGESWVTSRLSLNGED